MERLKSSSEGISTGSSVGIQYSNIRQTEPTAEETTPGTKAPNQVTNVIHTKHLDLHPITKASRLIPLNNIFATELDNVPAHMDSTVPSNPGIHNQRSEDVEHNMLGVEGGRNRMRTKDDIKDNVDYQRPDEESSEYSGKGKFKKWLENGRKKELQQNKSHWSWKCSCT
ncbi:hypothetical protein B7463_g1967, partial [Scytalidium lignicola]